MAKDKSEKKHKKSKEVTEEVQESIVPASKDVEMGEAEVAKVSLLLQWRAQIMTMLNVLGRNESEEGQGRDCYSARGPLSHRPPISAKEAAEETSQNYQEGCVLRVDI